MNYDKIIRQDTLSDKELGVYVTYEFMHVDPNGQDALGNRVDEVVYSVIDAMGQEIDTLEIEMFNEDGPVGAFYVKNPTEVANYIEGIINDHARFMRDHYLPYWKAFCDARIHCALGEFNPGDQSFVSLSSNTVPA
jgi:hypothetical protein